MDTAPFPFPVAQGQSQVAGANASGGGIGGTIMIEGRPYAMYSQAYYNALEQERLHQAQQAGTAAGTQQSAAMSAMGLGGLTNSLSGLINAASAPPSGGGFNAPQQQQQQQQPSAPGGGVLSTGSGIIGGGARVGAMAPMSPIAPIDMRAANAAAFSQAKNTAGRLGRASLDSLRGELGATGMLGGGAEVQGVRDIVDSNAGLLGNVANERAMYEANQAGDIAKTNYQGGLTQNLANYQGGITQRGQDIAAQEAQARLAQEQAALAQSGQLGNAQLALQQQQAAAAQSNAAYQRQLDLLKLAFGGLASASGSMY